MSVSINQYALVANSMLVSKNMNTSIFTPIICIVFRVTLVTWLQYANAPIARGLTCCIFFLYNVGLENHSVKNFPWGRGGVSMASPRSILKEEMTVP